jgi:hypothetical protein
MKIKHIPSIRLNAIETLKALNLNVNQDFHALRSSQVDALLECAIAAKYQAPFNANGSRARYFHAKLIREAKLK